MPFTGERAHWACDVQQSLSGDDTSFLSSYLVRAASGLYSLGLCKILGKSFVNTQICAPFVEGSLEVWEGFWLFLVKSSVIRLVLSAYHQHSWMESPGPS